MTAVLPDPLTVAWIVVDCPPVSEAEVGETVIDTGGGVNETTALALLVLSAALVAVTVTDCAVVTDAGAVYTPLVMVPSAGVSVQLTAVLLVPVTLALNVAD